MNHKLKIGLAFVAGALISNAGTVMSNVPNGQDVLAEALSSALDRVNRTARDQRMKNSTNSRTSSTAKTCSG